MRFVDLLHRWMGATLGAILAVLGLTGAILVHKEDWIALPHVDDQRVSDPAAIGALTEILLRDARGGESLIYASDRFGLVQLRRGEGEGAYASQSGEIVTAWQSQWERPELWLFDLHHHLFAGENGEAVVGVAGIAGMLFVVTGAILWWRTRRTFRLRGWPARWTKPAIRMHHRDLGIVAAPLLFIVTLTGTMMIFRPVAGVVLSPLSPPEAIEKAITAPKFAAGSLAGSPDWAAMIAAAHRLYPEAQFRLIALPRKQGDPITVRLKQPAEWLPNGRTMVWFDPASGRVLAHRDALTMPAGAQAFNAVYPIHAAKIGGLPYRLVMTFAGLAMAMLGGFAMWSFWRGRGAARGLPKASLAAPPPAARSVP